MTYIPNIRAIEVPTFLTLNAKKIFNHLLQMFIKAQILQYFDPKCHIWIKPNALGYNIAEILSLLNLNFDKITLDNLNLIKFDFGQ